jgi:hypothetical protein
MTQPQTYTVTGSARIEADPARVYGIIADYHHGHPSIVPKQFRMKKLAEVAAR